MPYSDASKTFTCFAVLDIKSTIALEGTYGICPPDIYTPIGHTIYQLYHQGANLTVTILTYTGKGTPQV